LVAGEAATFVREDAMDRRDGFVVDYYVAQGSRCRAGYSSVDGFCVDLDGQAPGPEAIASLQASPKAL
jgi:hypothetical protein